MTDKQLTNKAIDIKGKKYVLVSDRVLYFNETYPNWSIVTQRVMIDEAGIEVFKATVTPDCSKPERFFTGYSQAKWWDGFINKTSALENAETSAVGRALAMMWIWVIDSIASVDEIHKAENTAKIKATDDMERFEKAKQNVEFMQQCLDEADFIKKVKNKYSLTKQQETDLRICYQNAKAMENIADNLPFQVD